tara:strand:+ start:677 stop:940 length:264 start_codon:yes stop_codon:yes gene_type:complete
MNSLDNLSALVIAGPEDILSLAFTCEEIQDLHLWLPAISGASQDKQQMAKPICSMARLGRDMCRRVTFLPMKPTNVCTSVRKTEFDK